jgi:alkanesulfonate monooxygenase SsuD/methylene tetrahydromethanopterin reductase-like flavin-dependent oxidoreductase (luciferase family)
VEFGIFNSVHVPQAFVDEDGAGAEHRRIMDEVEFTKCADRSGFKYTWATEHHFLHEYSHLSCNESFLAYMAAATDNIHLGSGIFNITPPVNHPARVAERVAMLDHLSGGRFEFGMGRGSSTTEQKGFGIDDPDLTKEMFDEVVGQFKHMWRETDYSFDGRFFSMPERNVLPKPLTNPHPPMWVAAGNPSTFEKAGRMGLGVLCFSMMGPEALKPLIETYKLAIEDAEPVGEYVNNNIMATSSMLCLEDSDRVKAIMPTLGMSRHISLLFRYLDTFPRIEGVPEWPEVLPDLDPDMLDLMFDPTAPSLLGTPEQVSGAVQQYADAGVDQLTFGMLSSEMHIDIACEAIETFGRHVIPEFDRDPVHSTTRQREAQLARPD